MTRHRRRFVFLFFFSIFPGPLRGRLMSGDRGSRVYKGERPLGWGDGKGEWAAVEKLTYEYTSGKVRKRLIKINRGRRQCVEIS